MISSNLPLGRKSSNFRSLVDYIRRASADGQDVEWERVTNCVAQDPDWAVLEVLATQACNTRCGPIRSYHMMFSLAPGEVLTKAQFHGIEDRLVEAVGLAGHQRVSALHTNTPNLHVHVAISKVHPRTLHNVTPYFDHFEMQKVGAVIEAEYGLAPTRHSRTSQETIRNRDMALKELEAEHSDYRDRLNAYHAKRLENERSRGSSGILRRQAFDHLARRRQMDNAERVEREARERRAVLDRYPAKGKNDQEMER